MENYDTKIRPTLVAMKVGETRTFHISRMKSVRTQASELGAMYDRSYTTHTDRINKTIDVTRQA